MHQLLSWWCGVNNGSSLKTTVKSFGEISLTARPVWDLNITSRHIVHHWLDKLSRSQFVSIYQHKVSSFIGVWQPDGWIIIKNITSSVILNFNKILSVHCYNNTYNYPHTCKGFNKNYTNTKYPALWTSLAGWECSWCRFKCAARA